MEHVDATGQKTGIEEGAEDRPRHPLFLRAHCAPGESRPIPQADTAGRLQGRMVGGRGRRLEVFTPPSSLTAPSEEQAPGGPTPGAFRFLSLVPAHASLPARWSRNPELVQIPIHFSHILAIPDPRDRSYILGIG